MATVIAVLAGGGAAYVAVSRHESGKTPLTQPVVVRPAALPALAAETTPSATGVSRSVRRALNASGLAGSVAGLVVDGSTGASLFADRADGALAPASTLKLFTAAAALSVLHPGDTLRTRVARSGNSIYLIGGGDVTVTATTQPGYPPTATFAYLAAQTASALGASGHVHLRYDAGAWTGPPQATGWTPTYFTSGNISRLSDLELNEARLTSGATAPRAPDPALQAADEFRRALIAAGVDVKGEAKPASVPPAAADVASVSSPPVAALVQRMLTTSDNDLAEALGRLVAQQSGRPATFTGAADAVRAAVERLGVPMRHVQMYDASGLSRLDRVTPRALVTLLRLAQEDATTYSSLLAGLPVAGFTGTLADRYRHGPSDAGAGVVRAKTGTLAGVNALAGQVVDADGRLLVFAFIADHVPSPDLGESALDRLAAALARCGCGST